MGYEGEPSNSASINANTVRAEKGTGTPGTGNSISIFCRNSGDSIKGVLWDFSTLNVIANGITNIGTAETANTWVKMDFPSAPTIEAKDYYIGVIPAATITIAYDSGTFATNSYFFDPSNSYATPETLDGTAYSIYRMGAYCTYTESAGGLSIPRPLSRPLSGPFGGI